MKKTIMTMLLSALTMGAAAQTERSTSGRSLLQGRENPRGIYKMTTLTGKLGEVKAPYEQYKICTDSVTLMVSEQGNRFSMSDNDHRVFNYTGEQPKSEGDESTLIYDSNDKQFKLKWWSTYASHIHFPNNDWCIEKYESGKYSETSKVFFDALIGAAADNADNPLTGTWRFIGYVDELRDVKKELPKLHEQYPTSRYFNSFMVFTPQNLTTVFSRGGGVDKIELDGKKAYKSAGKTYQIKWLSKNRIAIEDRVDYRTDWMILERVTDGSAPLRHIVSLYVGNRR